MLENFFKPRSMAILGASSDPNKLGYNLVKNMTSYGYKGNVYPVNPKAGEILGLKSYKSLEDVPRPVDLAVIAVAPKYVLEAMDQCGRVGIESAVIITGGFKETGRDGAKLEREVAEAARRNRVRLIGPNCIGIIDTFSGVNASFAADMPLPGNIGVFSQSGAICVAILDWALGENVGFSRFVSLGNEADITETEILESFGQDDQTKVIIGYLESVERGRDFMETAYRISHIKPVIIIKAGVTAAGAKAASSHTGAMAGSENAYEAAFKQAGIIRAYTMAELFNFSLAFSTQPLPAGSNLCIITNSGGPGIIAADAIEKTQLHLATLSNETIAELRTFLPPIASLYNPVDIIGDADAERYRRTLATIVEDTNIHNVLVMLAPAAITHIDETAATLALIAKQAPKPVVTCLMGRKRVEAGRKLLLDAGVPSYNYPESAINSLNAMYRHRQWLDRPERVYPTLPGDKSAVQKVFDEVTVTGRNDLIEAEARGVLQAYGFRVPEVVLAKTSDEAVAAAERIGYPVVMKIVSPQVLHKSDLGGVALGLADKSQVADAFFNMTTRIRNVIPQAIILGVYIQEMVTGGKEVILGLTKDEQFGPMVMFGLGGIYVEALKDVAFRIVPLSEQDAFDMIREIRAFPILRGVRGEQAADLKAIETSLLKLSQIALDFSQIIEADINPLMVLPQGQGAVAIDARFTLAKQA
ncbi:MAG: acetate--CoA ligase family protein [Deltaproteobacteria bacterium]|nr:acetate--CoA ligase family protein [Deltaproteobacteria bacterium]